MPLRDSEFLTELDSEVWRIDLRNFVSEDEAEKLSAENIAKEQHDDEDLAFLIACKQKGLDPPSGGDLDGRSEEALILTSQWDSLVYTDGNLYRLFEDVQRNNMRLQVFVPRRLRKAYIRQCHVGMTGGHMGLRKTQDQVARRAYFPRWKNMVADVCQSCEVCAKYCRGKPPKQDRLQFCDAVGVMESDGY